MRYYVINFVDLEYPTGYESTTSTQLLDFFHSVDFEYVPRESNWEANDLTQVASSVKMSE